MTVVSVVSRNNSTIIPLAADASFVGNTDDLTSFSEIDINVAGAPDIAPAMLYFEFSPDGVHWDLSIPVELSGPSIIPTPLRVVLPRFRVRYINGGTALTELRLTVVFHRTGAKHITRFLDQAIEIKEPVEVTRSVLVGQKPDDSFINIPLTVGGQLDVNQDTVIANLQALNSLVPSAYDYVGLTYTGGGDVSTVSYRLGGAGGTLVSTLTLGYTGSNLTSVTKT